MYSTTIVYCPEQKLVYVDNVKAGSSTISAILYRHFNCVSRNHHTWAAEHIRQEKCEGLSAEACDGMRAKTDWLTKDELTGTTFFSAVREPLERFISGYKQAVAATVEIADWDISEYIQHYNTSEINQHTQTQVRRLSGRDASGKQVPMHFIASLETLGHDLSLLLAQLGLPPVDEFPKLRVAAQDPSKAALDTTLTTEQIRQLCQHLMQDYVCFGYPLPMECR
ncbi:hypothetical protein JKP88DRAFT_178095 [Tribonema minus]|uniref:Sulfotransferase family protein n=1 Tax=Tribonema minus TaxID=303371 RepID=A0A835Z9Q3_9STRA|nr:hypothetical protein JKP88DRAFT_178095 [Tribonema minus]